MKPTYPATVLPLFAAMIGALGAPAQDIGERPVSEPCRGKGIHVDSPSACNPHNLLAWRPNTPHRAPALVSPETAVSFTTLAAPPKARKAYKKAARELDKKHPDFAKATRYLEEAVTIYPRFAAAWHLLGVARVFLNDFHGTRRALENAIAADPRYPVAYALLAALELKLAAIEANGARVVEAARMAERALKLNPQLSLAHYHRAVAYHALGDSDTATESIRVVVNNGEARRFPGVYAVLGEIYEAEGDLPSAAVEYRRFLELEPDSPAADELRRRLAEWQAKSLIGLAPADQPDLKFTVYVYDYTDVSSVALARARKEVIRIYRAAGVEAEWVECPASEVEPHKYPACLRDDSREDWVQVRLVSRPMMDRLKLGWTMFGVAAVPDDGEFGKRAVVCSECVQPLVERKRYLDFGRILGGLIAHETGHLLLANRAHSVHGVMRAEWERGEPQDVMKGWVQFTTKEARRIQAQVRERMRHGSGTAQAHLPR